MHLRIDYSYSQITLALRSTTPHRRRRRRRLQLTFSIMAATPDQAPYTAPALFDSLGPAYEEAYSDNPEQTASIEWLLAELAKPARILDVGCGTGRPVCATLSEAGHSVLGIDVSRVMISAARERAPKAKFQQVDHREFESRPNVYDAITVYFSLILDLTQEEIRDSLRKFYDWLKPGGLFVFATVPIAGNQLEMKWMGRPIVVSGFAAEDVVAAVKEAGFKVVKEKATVFMPRAVEVGICEAEDISEESLLFVYAKKNV
jgi:SAM-dependent methyltransferase